MKVNIRQYIGESAGFFALFALALFPSAGTLRWAAGWIFLLLFFGFYLTVTLWLYRHDPGLLQERTRLSTSDQQSPDRILFPLMEFSFIAWMVFMSLDAVRFHWSALPLWLQGVGALVLLGSFSLLFLTFRENSYLSPVVRIQDERGHAVVSTGPYRYVRHPMYLAILVFIVGASLLLGSAHGLFFVLLCAAMLAYRAVLEEHTLQADLPAYAGYKAKVKYRLIPYVW